jgi:hypothetical protein
MRALRANASLQVPFGPRDTSVTLSGAGTLKSVRSSKLGTDGGSYANSVTRAKRSAKADTSGPTRLDV